MAGGDTGVGGNGSVYWRSRHYGSNQTKRKLKPKPAGPHNNDEIDLDSDEALGKDAATDVKDVGDRFGHKGFFLVTLRYETLQDAQAAGAWVAQNVQPGPGGYYLRVRVKAIDRSNPEAKPPLEIMVEW
jgi:hypothetical protein